MLGCRKTSYARRRSRMAYKAVLFDLDGTLLDTLQDLMDTMNHCLAAHGMPERDHEHVRRSVGNGIRKLV
ncbi:MAG: HAD hydrolase-like protein, partial [Atopobiaceae bacterium]|nr:HAD hydrolase-like protein [Atopobiaceae bacterium]